jgi:hypothetical protein
MAENRLHNSGGIIAGLLLVCLGGLLLLGEVFQLHVMGLLWPFFVIVPGLLLFGAMLNGGKGAAGLAIPASIVTMVGVLLFYQNIFNLWATWAYAWALVFPTAFGIGLVIQGVWSGDLVLRNRGVDAIKTGLIIFAVFALFFELLLNISGFRSGLVGRIFWPLLLIGLGVWLAFGRGLLKTRRP